MNGGAPVWGAATDVGAVRDHNEDALLTDPPLFAVADGMGGHAAGEVASALALEQLGALRGRADLTDADVRAAIAAANEAILSWSADHPETAGMGTTVTGACLGGVDGAPQGFVFNVGDSRVYQFRDGVLTRVTTDHSEVQELLDAGQLTPDQAEHYIRRNVVTRSLGSQPAPAPDIFPVPTAEGTAFVICSDGLTNEVDEGDIAGVLGQVHDPQQAADTLVQRAVAAGG
ncbi:MAG TPA: protein phosphatase 2C domain-containing protein, partial [Micromonosporaceae bacterium]